MSRYFLCLIVWLLAAAPQAFAVTFVQVSAGAYHTCAVLAGGEAVCWGKNDYAQATPPQDLMTEVSVGNTHSCGIKKSDNSVICWGDNTNNRATPPNGAFWKISAGSHHTCGLKSDGSPVCWGKNDYGQTRIPSGIFSQISAGSLHTCALKTDGASVCWGYGGNGQTSAQSGTFIYLATGGAYTCGIRSTGGIACWGDNIGTPPSGAFYRLEAGDSHACAWRTDGSTICWGDNTYAQAISPIESFSYISAGSYHTCGTTKAGEMVCWGAGNSSNDAEPHYGQAAVSFPWKFIQVSSGGSHSCALKDNHKVICWGDNRYGQSSPPLEDFIQITTGNSHTCGIKMDKSLACWGYNLYEQTNSPQGSFIKIAAGADHTCGIKEADNSLKCWGYNALGQANSYTGSFAQIAAGYYHTCGIRLDGGLVCWGHNQYGQISFPSGNFLQIEGGYAHTCGIKSDNSVVCWGMSGYGRTTPPSGSFTQIEAGYEHTCGIRSDNTLACWGSDAVGQASYPSGYFTQITAGNNYNCGLTPDGKLDCWGNPNYASPPKPPLKLIIPPLSLFTLSATSGVSPLTVQASSNSYDPNGTIASYLWTASNGQQHTNKIASFNFTIPGDYILTLIVTDDEGATRKRSQTVKVSEEASGGGGSGGVCLSFAPGFQDFGGVVPNQSASKTLHVTNSCQANLTINLAAISGTAEFGLSNDLCSNRTLSYQQSCTVDVRFHPTKDGLQQGNLVVQYGTGQSATAGLRGTGSALLPTACIKTPITNGLKVTLDGSCSTDSNGSIMRYDWRISSLVNPVVTRTNHLPSDNFVFTAPGDYTAQLTVTDNDGATHTTTAPFRLDYSIRLDNISVRCHIQASPKTAIVGFVIEGTGQKTVLLRGLAVPSMSPALDVRLSLNKLVNNVWQEILTNDNWMQSSRATEIRNLPSNFVPRSTADAALLVDLEPGVYTLIATPQGTGGIGIVGADDLDAANPSSRFINISGRCAVESGNGNAIAGFVIEGQGTLKNLLRGLRIPSLSGQLDPSLELIQLYPGNPVADILENNNNWEDHPRQGEIRGLAANLHPRDYRDSGILRDMPAGVFTVLMKPNGEFGIGLVGVDALE